MEENTKTYTCLNCNQPETVVPLVNLRYSGKQAWICSQCMPVLIHRPAELVGKLAHAENFEAAPEDCH